MSPADVGVLRVNVGGVWRDVGCGGDVPSNIMFTIDHSTYNSWLASGVYNGNRASSDWYGMGFGTNNWVIDLDGVSTYVDHVNLLLYYADSRTYVNLGLDGSDDYTTWTTIRSPADYQPSVDGIAGLDIPVGTSYRYLRFHCDGNSINTNNEWVELEVWAGTAPGRLRLWTGTEWVQEVCDGDGGLSGTADLDTFDRADATHLGTASSTLVYTNTTNGPSISGNQAVEGGGAANFLPVGSGDHYAEISFTPGAASPGRCRLFVKRDTGDSHSYSADFDSGAGGGNLEVDLDRYATNLATNLDTGIPWDTSKTYRVSLSFTVSGRVLEVKASDGDTTWSHSINEPDQGWDASTKVGFQLTGADVTADDFSATPLTLAPLPHPLRIEDPSSPGTWIDVACFRPV